MVDWHVPVVTCAFMLLDVVTGVLQALRNGKLSSTVMREGAFHKMGFVLVVVLAYLCEYAMTYLELGFTVPLVPTVCVYICLTEVVSVLENLCELAPEIADGAIMKLFGRDID